MVYGSETKPFIANVGVKLERAEMQMIRWMCGISMKDRRTASLTIDNAYLHISIFTFHPTIKVMNTHIVTKIGIFCFSLLL